MSFQGRPTFDIWVPGNTQRIFCRRIQDHFTPKDDHGPWARAIIEPIVMVIPSDDLVVDEPVMMRFVEMWGFRLRNDDRSPPWHRREKEGHVYVIADFREYEAYVGATSQEVRCTRSKSM